MKILFPLMASILLVLLIACSDDEPADRGNQQQASSDQLSIPRNATRQSSANTGIPNIADLEEDKPLLMAQRLHGQAVEPGNGLELPIFATDRSDYQQSLRLIAKDSTDEQYQKLDAALKWLLINDLSILNDEQRLFEKIHGMTGNEVLAMVAEQIAGR